MTTPDPNTVDYTGVQLVECVVCGTAGLPERIHSTACPHGGE